MSWGPVAVRRCVYTAAGEGRMMQYSTATALSRQQVLEVYIHCSSCLQGVVLRGCHRGKVYGRFLSLPRRVLVISFALSVSCLEF